MEANKPNLKIPPHNQKLFEANLDALGKEMAAMITPVPAQEIAIDEDVTVTGLKNPIFLVIIGLSTLRVLEAAKKIQKQITNIIIIEPSLPIFKQTLAREWIGGIAMGSKIDLLVGVPPEEMFPHLLRIFTHFDPDKGSRATRCQTPEFVIDPFAYPFDQNGKMHPIAEQVKDVVIDSSKQVFLSMGCGSDSFYRWEQMVINKDNLQKSYRIEPLFQKFKGMPAIVLGAGPSMKDFIDAYHEYDLGNRAVIIACDASLRKLLDHNVRPHFVTRCERKLTQIFEGVTTDQTKDIFYAAYPWCPPEYFDLFESSFMLFRGNGVCKWSGYNPGEVNGGVSSANAAMELAALFGCDEIILSGVDLCFLDGKSHVEGTMVEFDVEKSRKKWKKIPGNSGEVTSIPVWMRCLNEYQGTVYKHKPKTFWNTSINGAKITGTKVAPWFELNERGLFKHLEVSPLSIIKNHLDRHTGNYAETFDKIRLDSAKYFAQCRIDILKLLGNLEDSLLISRREEERLIAHLKVYTMPHEYLYHLNDCLRNITQMYLEPSRQIDQFKAKYYVDRQFTDSIMDIAQLDTFQIENRCSSLKNLQDKEHDRAKLYVQYNLNLFTTYLYYLDELIKLLTHGPDRDTHIKGLAIAPKEIETKEEASLSFIGGRASL